ncbi:hypothetical protein PCC7424_3173 [Gloeothece citriformis PCC 7424]|uniref:Uncharacterized protein n=2 Tax=Gloeothece TaxID=28070 RepID=B7KCM4_GLOC7|nr:hypothetical protein PCC7424_3173 [Gloeothece citriformis PCC 7424]
MSRFFCLLIPSKLFNIDKNFSQKIQERIKKYPDKQLILYYSLLNLKDFASRQDINLDIPSELYNRYHVLDFSFYFPDSEFLQDLLSWLANIYSYGNVGLLTYWSDHRQRYPAITLDQTGKIITDLSVKELTLDKIFFVPLKQYI